MQLTVAHNFINVVSRQRGIATFVFVVIFAAAIVFGLVLSERYEAQMEILVEQGQLRRAEPVVTGGSNAQPIVNQQNTVTDAELNSEIALLRSQGVLRQVVVTCGLDSKPGFVESHLKYSLNFLANQKYIKRFPKFTDWLQFDENVSEDRRIARAVNRLANKLQVGVIKMSDVIVVTYRSSDPELAAHVLQTLGDDYLKEHALVHRPPGGFTFFQQETEQARKNLEDAEAKLVNFSRDQGVASADVELNDALKRLNDVVAMQGQARALLSETHERLYNFQAHSRSIPARQLTQLKTSDNAQLLQQLKSTLLSLQLRRTELLTKFQPTYPSVREVDRQIIDTRTALNDAERSQWQEKTTDRDPNYEMVREETTRSQAELAGLNARSASLAQQRKIEEANVQQLQRQNVQQQDLLRNVKAAEDNYMLYLHKSEEARISDELDKLGILNVTIAQAATVPALPVHSGWWYIALGWILAMFASAGSAVVADKLDPTLRTTEEVEWMLDTPVLAALPRKSKREHRNELEDDWAPVSDEVA